MNLHQYLLYSKYFHVNVSNLFLGAQSELCYLDNTIVTLENGSELLRDTELQVSQVAAQCGFSTPSYFIRRFHKRRGVTPGAYRLGGGAR